MSARSSIVNALVEKLKLINGLEPYSSNLFNNVTNKLKFYDEINDFPYVCVVAGYESREYLPSDFKWGYLNISIKIYVHNEDSQGELEKVLGDMETVIHDNEQIAYGTEADQHTAEILITSIQTDEGVLSPIGVGEINLVARYQVV